MKSSLFFLSVAGTAAPALAAAIDYRSVEFGEAYLVDDNVTFGEWDHLDGLPGVTHLDRLQTRSEEYYDGELAGRIEARDSKIETKVWLGTKYIDWGCDTSVKDVIRRSVDALCYNGNCGYGQTYVREVKPGLPGQQTGKRGNLKVEIDGSYEGMVRRNFIEGLMALSTDETHKNYEKRWSELAGRGASVPTKCQMTRFPNYLKLQRRLILNDDDANPITDVMTLRITPPGSDSEDSCMPEALDAIAAVFDQVAGGWFGTAAELVC